MPTEAFITEALRGWARTFGRWMRCHHGTSHLSNVILTQVGPHQDAFCDFFEYHLAPALRVRKTA
jgi:hypothetical protein